MAFGKEIKRLRESIGISSDKMASVLGINKVERYRNWEKRDTNPKFPDLNNIEQIFGMPLEEINRLEAIPEDILLKIQNDNKHQLPMIIPENRPDVNHAPKGRFPKRVDHGKLIKFYDTDFAAGDIEFYDDSKHNKPSYTMDVPEFSGCTAFRTYGDSMENLIKSGSILFGTKIEDWKSHLEYGQIYGIVCTDKRRYLKFIRKGKDENEFLLKSENSEKYDDFAMPKSKIKSIWLIHGWINKRT